MTLPTAIESVCDNCEQQINEWCCVTSWNGRCCEFPLEVEKPKPTGGFFNRWFSSRTEAPKTTQMDRDGYHNSVEIKKELRVPYYRRVLGDRVNQNQNPNGNHWWALYG